MQKQILKTFFLTTAFLIAPKFADASIIFQTNFDNVATWNPSGANTPQCWQSDTSTGQCQAGPLPSTLFSDYRVQDHVCSKIYPVHIGSATDISSVISQAGESLPAFTPYGGTGKSYVHFYEPCMSSSGGWGSDGQLGVYFGGPTGANGYQELYVQYMVKFMPGFQWVASGVASGAGQGEQQKLAHIMHDDPTVADGEFNEFNTNTRPDFVPTLYMNTHWWSAPQANPSYYVFEDGSSNVGSETPSSPTATNISDGNWHTVRYHVKLNTVAGAVNNVYSADGVSEYWIDGVLQTSRNDIAWTLAQTPNVATYGFNRIDIGGNTDNTWLPGSDDSLTMSNGINPACAADQSCANQWYSVDNWVVFTSPGDVATTNYVPSSDIAPIPNGGSADVIAPTAPSGLSVQ